jgi:hypothetical protein
LSSFRPLKCFDNLILARITHCQQSLEIEGASQYPRGDNGRLHPFR